MRGDIVQAFGRHKDLTNVIVMTFNIDLIFVEMVPLRALARCGHPSLTIFVDAEEVSRTYDSQARWLAGIGRRFRVVPVAMLPGYRFHPKAVLLSGKSGGELLVGSGNTTFGGFRQNEEVWTSFSTADGDTGPFTAFRDMVNRCLSRCPSGTKASRDVAEAFDSDTRIWARELSAAADLIWRVNGEPALFEQMRQVIGTFAVDRIIVCSPYFDERGAGLRRISESWPQAQLEVLVQPDHGNLTRGALNELTIRPRLKTLASGREGPARPFIHGKFYAFISGNDVVLFAGSANCSAAALIRANETGNAELLAVRRMSRREFEEQVLAELVVSDEVPTIPETPTPEATPTANPAIRVLEASYEAGVLHVMYSATDGVELEACCVDGTQIVITPEMLKGDGFRLSLTQNPRTIHLEATSSQGAVTSRDHWVNHEGELSVTSPQRKAASGVADRISPAQWSLGSWTEVMRLLSDHLKYEPTAVCLHAARQKIDETPRSYASDDFFTAKYGLPSRRTYGGFDDESGRILGLQRLLLNYLGADSATLVVPEDESLDDEEDEGVDRPAPIPKPRPAPTRQNKKRTTVSPGEQQKARQIARRVINRVLEEQFLRHRSQDLLANDLTIVSVLLMAGYNESWLAADQFVALTYDVWIRLFFDAGGPDSDGSAAKGWLQLRMETTEDPTGFRTAVGTVPLAAALTMWSISCPDSASKPERARFLLATRMAVSRLPWLWNVQRIDDVAEQIEQIASRTGWLQHDSRGWALIREHWNRMLGEGMALGRLERALASLSLGDWRGLVQPGEIRTGTLLWQGSKGFGVATSPVKRFTEHSPSTEVLLLRAQKSIEIKPSHMLPVQKLLEAVATAEPSFTTGDVQMLVPLLHELEGLLGGLNVYPV